MYLIKLNATPSTNDYLKNLSVTNDLNDFTVVWSAVQTKGRGQMGSNWITDDAKNLTFSIFTNGNYLSVDSLFSLNILVANAVLKALFALNLTNIYVKWPNDILSYNKKIGGILIENNIGSNGKIKSIIGIGINLLQTDFNGFPQASSLLNQYGIAVEFELLLTNIVENIKQGTQNLQYNMDAEWQFYHDHLFKKEIISVFEDKNGKKFNGIIKEVNHQGQLVVQLENDDLQFFNLKDVKLLY